jgi:hypothetical protein
MDDMYLKHRTQTPTPQTLPPLGSTPQYHADSQQQQLHPQEYQFTPAFLVSLLQGMGNQIGHSVTAALSQNSDSSHAPRPKLGNPEPFKGARKQYKSFIHQIQIIFDAEPRTYSSDSVKISYLQSYVRGDALSWILSRRELYPAESFLSFEAAFSAIFGDPFEKEDKIRRLQSLTQNKTSCAHYTAEFRQVSTTLGLSNLDLCIRYYNGLANHVKDGLVSQNANYLDTELSDLMFLAVQIDNRNYDRQKERNSRPSSSNHPRNYPNNSTSVQSHYRRDDPMQVDSAQSQPYQYKKGERITPEERQRRMDNHLCLICGEAGHGRKNCPLNRYNKSSSSITSASTSSTGKESTPQ